MILLSTIYSEFQDVINVKFYYYGEILGYFN